MRSWHLVIAINTILVRVSFQRNSKAGIYTDVFLLFLGKCRWL